jgi:hypothetical protein
LGHHHTGWSEEEQCQQQQLSKPMPHLRSIWKGEDLQGKTLLLFCDQGVGDAIQFIRYVSHYKELGGRIIVCAPFDLIRLFSCVPGIDQVIEYDSTIPLYDFYQPITSIPSVFSREIEKIPKEPYLKAPAELVNQWKLRCDTLSGVKVGLVWSGNPRFPGNCFRLIEPSLLAPLLQKMPECTFVSLQKAQPGRIIASNFVDWTLELSDFAETAALIENLDLVISVDTSIPHLTGALGKPAFVLLSSSADWRWLLHRSDSPWYPTLKLFRQKKRGDWSSVLEEVLNELKMFISK